MKRDAFWSGLEATISASLSIVSSFLLARIVGPAEFGIGAAATAIHVVLWVVVNALFADALVQRATIDDRISSSAFWASCVIGCLAMLLQGVAGLGLAAMFGDHRLVPMCLVLAAPLPLVGAAGVLQGLLTRDRAYRRLALRTLVGQGLGTVTGVLAALGGAGAWAFVCQQAMTSACGALTLLLTLLPERGWRPQRCLELAEIRSLMAVAVPLTASTLVMIARYRLFAVLLGGTAGAAVLGQVHMAFRLVDTVRDLTFTALWRLMLPAMSRHQHDRGALLSQVDRWLRWCVMIIWPLCVMLAIGLCQIVVLVMGTDWAASIRTALPLVGLMAWSGWTFPSGVALVALGQARFALHANLASLACSTVCMLLCRPTNPWQAVTIWTIGQLVVSPYLMWANARALRVGILRPLTGGLSVRGAG